jgi:hypothetical protein
MTKRFLIGLTFVAALMFAAQDATAASKCTALKYQAAGRAALAKAKCQADAAKSGTEVSALCLTKADVNRAKRWARAEKKADCVETSDLSPAGTVIDDFLAALVVALESPTPPPTPTPLPGPTATPGLANVCCNTDNSCWQGDAFFAASECVLFGGTPGAPGTVCDGATGSCQSPPVGTGQCCFFPEFNICKGGPSIDPAGCVTAGGLDFQFVATCQPSGACSFGGP